MLTINRDSHGFRYTTIVNPENHSDDKLRVSCRRMIWGLVTSYAEMPDDQVVAEFMKDNTVMIMMKKKQYWKESGHVVYPMYTRHEKTYIYFAKCKDRLYFLGCILVGDASMSMLMDLRSFCDVDRGNYLIPCKLLADARSIADTICVWNQQEKWIPRCKPHITWASHPCYLCMSVYPEDGKFKRFPEDEFYRKIRLRCRIYKSIDVGNVNHSYVKDMIHCACPMDSEREAALESIILFLMGLCFSKSIGTYIHYEMEIMKIRYHLQMDTPQKRKHVLEFNKLLPEYERDVWNISIACPEEDNVGAELGIDTDFFYSWFLKRYRDHLKNIEDSAIALIESSNQQYIPDTVRSQIVAIGNIIKDELYDL